MEHDNKKNTNLVFGFVLFYDTSTNSMVINLKSVIDEVGEIY